MRLWLKGNWYLLGYPMRVFKWSVDFHLSFEPSVIPTWIGLDGLPIHLFNKSTLFSTANLVGKLMKIDEPTANLSRPSVTRICAEVDLLKSLLARIWIGTGGSTNFWQRVCYEDLPSYCNHCLKIGLSPNQCKKTINPASSNPKKQPAGKDNSTVVMNDKKKDIPENAAPSVGGKSYLGS